MPVADFDFKLEFDCRNTIEKKNDHVLFSVKRKVRRYDWVGSAGKEINLIAYCRLRMWP